VDLIAIALALIVGVTLGLLGGGGAVLTVPILVYVIGLAPKTAVPLSLMVVGLASAVGAWMHWRAGRLAIGPTLRFAAFTVVGAFVGAQIGQRLPDVVQLSIFAVVVLLAASSMWRSVGHEPTPRPDRPRVLLPVVGVTVGAITGVVGVGGGFLFVPALVALLQYPIARATAASLLVIALNAVAALIGYGAGIVIPWAIAIPFVSCTILGMFAGQALAPRFRSDTLKRAFSIVLALVGSFVLLQTLR
jgi:uncharacterized protein